MAEDQELLEKVASGSRSAFNELFKKYHRYLVSIAYSYTHDMDISRDLSQEVFLDVWKRREKIEINSSFKSFIRRAVINQSLSRQKQKKYHAEIGDSSLQVQSDDDSSQKLEYNELQGKIEEIVLALPDRCREVFQLSRYEGKSHKEIASILEISTKTIENQMTKALRTLREGLKSAGLMGLMIIIINLLRGY